MRLALLSGAGNSFAVLDATRGAPPEDPADLARSVCADRASALFAAGLRAGLPELPERALDGLLLILPPESTGDCRMVIYNADGSRPAACGNGLRCAARFARERELAQGDVVQVETDAGTRRVVLVRVDGTPQRARASMGKPRVLALRERLEVDGVELRAALVDLGNPHCVLFVDDVSSADVARLGPLIEHHALFPERTNVEFAALRSGRLELRVWERGVGETAACGTGACAAAVAAQAERMCALPLEVDLPGGRLTVRWSVGGEVELEGPCLVHAEGEWESARTPAARTQ
jgi:diaminopimelate epimerase